MLYSLTGTLTYLENDFAVIDCNGVGYKCFVSSHTRSHLASVGQQITLYTFLSVKEDSISLYGFIDNNELNCFKLLISVSGVGAKVAIAILSSLKPEQIAMAIGSGDFKMITVAQGVGPKLAKRIILELKDKLQKINGLSHAGGISVPNSPQINSNYTGAMNALEVLGYSGSEISQVLAKLDQSLEVEELIKLSLRELSKGV